ncbi:Far upstream element-binding protein 1 [Phlyctochytrium planicorne]|nr:Far upstream element-binding protein 1 [Phlyctochytrium planicorne]
MAEQKEFLDALAKAKAVAARLNAEARSSGLSDQAPPLTSGSKRERDEEDEDDFAYSRRRDDLYSDSKRRSTDEGGRYGSGRPRYGLGSSERSSDRGSDDRFGSSGGGGGGYGPPKSSYGPPSSKNFGEMSIPSNMVNISSLLAANPSEYLTIIGKVGLVIGKGGENMKRIEREANVKVQFSQDQSPNEPERRTTILGSDDGIRTAKRLINEILDGTSKRPEPSSSSSFQRDDYGSGGASSAGSGSSHYGPRPGASSTFPMEVPAGKVGLVIGRMGETIKSLQEKSGAKIAVVPDNASDPKSTVRTVNITGSTDAIEKAKGLINELSFGGYSGGESGEFEELKIPNDKVGLVIGKGGEAIKTIQSMHSVKIVIDQTPNHLNERAIKVYGTRDDILRAVEAILEKTMSRARGGQQNNSNYGYGGGGGGYDANSYGQQQDYSQYWDPSAYAAGYDASAYYGQAQGQGQGQGQDPAADPAAKAAWDAYYAGYYSQYGNAAAPATESGQNGQQ